ncbi:MAG TPA: phytanoyl-CoA dioxygenase family protein [Gaiellaceae bacterium]|nr:phytanoyl-CoA dioxygenase family protein [Gaiellaceae bacterium]
MHRSRTAIVTAAPGRLQPKAQAFHRKGVATTYKLHDRLLSNRRARALYTANRPSLDDTQRRLVQELLDQGFALVPFTDLFPEDMWQAIEQEGEEFVNATKAGLEGDAGELRKRAGKDYLVRKYDVGGVIDLDNPWLTAATDRRLLDVANEYLQLWSKIEYLDMWYSLPVGENAERKASQIWHRDFDDSHLLKAFLYLSDVDATSGPFEYVPGSHPGGPYAGVHPWAPMGVGRISEPELAKFVSADEVKTFTAPRGSLILCNTSGLHRGGFAEANPRVLAAATYCSPASLHSLTERNYSLAPGSSTSSLDPVVRFALR